MGGYAEIWDDLGEFDGVDVVMWARLTGWFGWLRQSDQNSFLTSLFPHPQVSSINYVE